MADVKNAICFFRKKYVKWLSENGEAYDREGMCFDSEPKLRLWVFDCFGVLPNEEVCWLDDEVWEGKTASITAEYPTGQELYIYFNIYPDGRYKAWGIDGDGSWNCETGDGLESEI